MFRRYRTTPRFGLSLTEEAQHVQITYLETGYTIVFCDIALWSGPHGNEYLCHGV
jgi:hypothetical protein